MRCSHVTTFQAATSLLFVLQGCTNAILYPSESSPQEAINPENDPRGIDPALGIALERRLQFLPLSGSTHHKVWSGDYYPNSAGGTSKAGSDGMSPMEKYELATGTKGALDWERKDARDKSSVEWSGHCNGLAAASLLEKEPLHKVIVNGITFFPDDIKALLVEAWQGSGRTIGLRCDLTNAAKDGDGRVIDAACRDLNPGTLHLAVTNFIGMKGLGLIIDQQADEPVWNWAVSSYSATLKSIDAGLATSLVGNGSGHYAFNKNAATFWDVSLALSLPAAGTTVDYRYVLEGDKDGRIFGGEWIDESKTQHPDFIWRPGVRKSLNPYLDYEFMKSVLSKSL